MTSRQLTIVENVFLSCDPATWYDLEPDKGTAQHGPWTLACNFGQGPKIVGKATAGFFKQDKQFAGFMVSDRLPTIGTPPMVVNGVRRHYEWSHGMQVIFDTWIPCSQIKAGLFGGHNGSAMSGSELQPYVVHQLRSVMAPHYRQLLDALVTMARNIP